MKRWQPSELFTNRELSWLKFNERVLRESQDPQHPLLERVRFLSITSSNLDEFFMVRVGGLFEQFFQNISTRDIAGMSVAEQLAEISKSAHRLVNRQYRFWGNITPQLEEAKIEIKDEASLSPKQREWLENYFEKTVLPALTPLGVDKHHPFPFLLNKSINLAVLLSRKGDKKKKVSFHTAIIQLPALLPRLILLPSPKGHYQFFFLEDLIKLYSYHLFRGYTVQDMTTFRITRNADFSVDDEEAEDLLLEMKKFLYQRSHGHTVRLEVEHLASKKLLKFLTDTLDIKDWQVFHIDGPIDLTFLGTLADQMDRPGLSYAPIQPYQRIPLKETSLFDQISQKDLMLHHPYDSFDPVIAFVQEAAKDPQVLAIKQTIYRSGKNPRLIEALIEAAHNGKQVTILMEVKARFDEENNLLRAKQLEEAGCHVIYGIPTLKTHGKIILVVRQEKGGIKRYLHFSTGNYNPDTAKVYTDIGFFTCDPQFGEDATALFNLLSCYSIPETWQKLCIAPSGLRKKFNQLIQREIKAAKRGESAAIVAKMNSLVDPEIIKKLYEASQAGVEIELIIRGICALKAEVPGLSENIRVRSLVGRFLEHSRIFCFYNSGNPEYYLSSADWMTRNLDNRVEILFPILAEDLKERLRDILATTLEDTSRAYILKKNNNYRKREVLPQYQFDSQIAFLKQDSLPTDLFGFLQKM